MGQRANLRPPGSALTVPLEVGLWRVDGGIDKVQRVQFKPMPDESKLEGIIASDISVVDPNLLLIGRQVPTEYGKLIDLLAIDPDGKLVVLELKRDKTPRDVVAQALDYGSWVRTLSDDDIATIFATYNQKHHPERASQSLDEAFCERFRVKELPETLNDRHELIIVAGDLDPSTERIVNYLSDEYGAAINVVFFRFFEESGAEYLSRVWLIDPGEVETKAVEVRAELPWNGEFYVSFGEEPTRRWADGRRLGYVAAGGGAWYTNTLKGLEPGNRIWVNVPGHGYVGVGEVLESAVSITEFTVRDENGEERLITDLIQHPPPIDRAEEELEHYVRVHWLQTVPLDQAIHEKGFFGNQNTVARPKARKWQFTIDRLKRRFGVG